ncbi:hypothetical protein ABZP36_022822 [Zizania latifolia]
MLDPRSEIYPAIEYRSIHPSDLEVIEKIHLALFPIRYEREFFLNVVNGHGIVSWGAVDTSRSDDRRDELIGFVTMRMIPSQDSEIEDLFRYNSSRKDLTLVYILTLGVVDRYRNLGIASSLVREVIKYAASISNCRGVYLHVISYNQPAISFYNKMLFKLVRRLPLFYYIRGQHYDSYLFVYYVNGGRSPCSPLEVITSFVVDFRAFLKMVVAKFWNKEERSTPKLCRCKESTTLLAFAPSAADHLASWLAAAAARGVEQLELHLPRSRLAVLPPSLITCTNLTSLTLRLDHYAHPLPSLSSLTRLSRLHLASISLARDNFFADLFSHCKQLRYLILEQCRIGALCLAGATQLSSLAITNCSWTQQSSVAFSDLPALRTLQYSGAMASRHIIDDIDSFDDVVLAIEKPQPKLQEPNLRELLALVGNVQSLVLSPWCIEQFARPEEWSKVWLNKVRQLTCIIERREEGAFSIAPLLSKCQNVEELSVSVVPSQCKRRRCSDETTYHGVVGCKEVMLRHLRTVRMVYIDESKSGLELVKLLLRNTPMLEIMTIVPSMDGLEQAKFRRRVLKFRKASRDADIQFSASG